MSESAADRLASLSHQRALIASHLAWLDREIAQATNDAPNAAPELDPPGIAQPAAATLPPAPRGSDSLAAAHARADEIIARFGVEDRFDADRTRRGCLALFCGVLALGACALFAIYYFGYLR